MIIKVSSHQYWWLAGGYDLGLDIFRSEHRGGTWWIVRRGFGSLISVIFKDIHYSKAYKIHNKFAVT